MVRIAWFSVSDRTWALIFLYDMFSHVSIPMSPLSSKALNPLRLNWHELTSCFSDQSLSLGRALEFCPRVSGFCGFGSVVDPFSLVGTTTYLACHRLTPQRMFFSQVRLSCNRCGHAKEVFKYNVNRIWPCWTAQSRQIYRSAHDWTLRDS